MTEPRKPARVMVATRISAAGKDAIQEEADTAGVTFSEMHRTLLGEALQARAAKRARRR